MKPHTSSRGADRGAYDPARFYLSCAALFFAGLALLGTDISFGSVVISRNAALGSVLMAAAAAFAASRLLTRDREDH